MQETQKENDFKATKLLGKVGHLFATTRDLHRTRRINSKQVISPAYKPVCLSTG